MSKPLTYVGIGSRSTPEDMLNYMGDVGYTCALEGSPSVTLFSFVLCGLHHKGKVCLRHLRPSSVLHPARSFLCG